MIKNQFLLFFIFTPLFLFCEIGFEILSINSNHHYLFRSLESIGNQKKESTLFYGEFDKSSGKNKKLKALSFNPETILFNRVTSSVFIQNRIGIYRYDHANRQIEEPNGLPSFTTGEEFSIYTPSKISLSPNGRFLLTKQPQSPTRADIYLYDTADKTYRILIKETDRNPGKETALWSPDSRYFIYQKEQKIYYFSLSDDQTGKQLEEKWRCISHTSLANCAWTDDNKLLWVEKNFLYEGDPEIFFYRSIYRNYLNQGKTLSRLPFEFQQSLDRFVYDRVSGKILLIQNNNTILFYSIANGILENSYFRLEDNMRFEKAVFHPDGEGAILIKILKEGKLGSQLLLIRKEGKKQTIDLSRTDSFGKIHDINIFPEEKNLYVCGEKGAYSISLEQNSIRWEFKQEAIQQIVSLEKNKYLLFGEKFAYEYDTAVSTPLFFTYGPKAGFFQDEPVVQKVTETGEEASYRINKITGMIEKIEVRPEEIWTETKNSFYRLLSREVKKSFYQDIVYLKEIYSGKQIDITPPPKLNYTLYQPELSGDYSFVSSPEGEKYDVALLFDCIKTGEGIFEIIEVLEKYKVKANFFLNGNFMENSPLLTKEISQLPAEVGNLFDSYINFSSSNFAVDKNFIRQGLSSNEEKYFALTGKNFSPCWHSPMFVYNNSIIRYGLESGYRFVSYHLDSLDWIDKNDRQLSTKYYLGNAKLIERLLTKLKPAQIILFSTGTNETRREEWLFTDMETILCEMIRSGYSFSYVSEILDRYRED